MEQQSNLIALITVKLYLEIIEAKLVSGETLEEVEKFVHSRFGEGNETTAVKSLCEIIKLLQ